jgi:hypothetical protein
MDSDKQEYLEKIQKANNKIKNSDYLISTTYNLVKDPKVLLNVVRNLSDAVDFAISALLYRDRDLKLISNFHDSPISRMNLFIQKFSKKYGFTIKDNKFITELHEIMDNHNNSPIEFSRNKEFIICDSSYKFKKINIDAAKDFLEKGKSLVFRIEKIIQTNNIK